MTPKEQMKTQSIRRTRGGAVDADYYYRRGKQMHDEEFDQAINRMAARVRNALQILFHAGEIGSVLNVEKTWEV